MNRECSRAVRVGAVLATVALFALGCDDSVEACRDDAACARGQLCSDGICTVVPCQNLRECPGSGRTCLYDLRSCSPKECADAVDGVELTCAATRPGVQGLQCIVEGGFRGSCVDLSSVECAGDEECAAIADGLGCCAGRCAARCADQGDIIPVGDAAPRPVDGGPPPGDVGPSGDAGPAPEVGPCSVCERDGDCRGLGDGARCTAIGDQGSFCTAACAADEPQCGADFFCYAETNQCIPTNYNCQGCPAAPCPEGQVCSLATGVCGEPSVLCEQCVSDQECDEGLACGNLNGQRYCLAVCPDGMCPVGNTCTDGACAPDSGVCDACGGICVGDRSACNTVTRECAECDARVPCPVGQICQDYACVEGDGCECVTPADCAGCGDRRVCFQGQCVACLQETDCPPRTTCSAQQTCDPSPCAGVACHRGTRCDAQSGLCVDDDGNPGCVDASDCADPPNMACNVMTRQCYYTNGSCDPGVGGDGVCPPGSSCSPNPIVMPGACSCRKVDPVNDPLGPDLVPCHPGGFCLHGEFPPGSGMVPAEGFCFNLPI